MDAKKHTLESYKKPVTLERLLARVAASLGVVSGFDSTASFASI